MTTRVITLMWGDAWDRYGQAFADSFTRYWPKDVELTIVTDRLLPVDRARQILLSCLPGYGAFMDRWRYHPKALGYDSTDRKADPTRRFWKHDAVKWAPQGIAPRGALTAMRDGEIVCWLDADVETTAPVPDGWVENLLDGHDVACLQRNNQHSEIGFWAMRLNSKTRKAIEMFATQYTNGAVFKLPEYHSAYVFDRALEFVPDLTIKNLNPSGMRGHCWPTTALAEYTVHKKGKLKDN